MKVITANTKISVLINVNPAAIDAIASINAHFSKLRNPVLRRILASRVTIADAAKIGKCDIEVFFTKMRQLGFIIDYGHPVMKETVTMQQYSADFKKLLDVRAEISNGKDPFQTIMAALAELSAGETLLLVNSFEPTPLIRILKRKEYKINVNEIATNEVHTYITKPSGQPVETDTNKADHEFYVIVSKFKDRIEEIDVRSLPMPQPMTTILRSLEALHGDMGLYVHHKRMPLFLLPELEERGYKVASSQVEDGVDLIIYRNI